MAIFLDLLVVVIAILLILFIATQIFVPMYTGEPMFPFFRKSAVKTEIAKAEDVLGEVAEIAHLKRVSEEIQRRTAEMEKKE
jgi:hypothetical protein